MSDLPRDGWILTGQAGLPIHPTRDNIIKLFLSHPILGGAFRTVNLCTGLLAEAQPTAIQPHLIREEAVLAGVAASVKTINQTHREVTFKRRRGHYLTARVADPANLTQIRIGENVVIFPTEALAIALEKAERKSAE